LLRFERCYDRSTPRAVRIGVTPSRRLAELWQRASGARSIGRFLRNNGYGDDLQTVAIDGDIYDAACEHDQRRLLCDLVRAWSDPGACFVNVRRLAPHTWAHADAKIDPRTRFIGPAWVGAGHTTEGVMSVLGPAVLWDEEKKCDGAGSDRLTELSLLHHTFTPSLRHCAIAQRPSFYAITKRLFDIVVSLLALAVTLPLYLLVMLVIWLEDGRPFLFVHRREAHGGREFGCLKFRTMRKDAEATKEQLAEQNRCDGPQFFIPRDPRVTRVGTFLRKYHIDEWPQFLNVLRGEMSLVGPRPSPFAENQFCPTWREARLSVPPGITGLWQVSRTRSSGNDFREWIEFDLQYVQQRGWRMDLYILWRTAVVVLFPHRAHRRATERGGGLSTTSPAVGSV
jgi:lipopolysaccharide/colanic/teichoic acid biosynthesis glycosyltransferase